MENRLNKKELVFDTILFVLSCLNTDLIYVFLLLTFLKIREGSIGFIKINMLFLLRQCFYFPGLASVSAVQSDLKLALIAIAAGYILVSYLLKHDGRIPAYAATVMLFGILASVSVLIWGSYPVAGFMKAIAFALVFLSTVLAVTDCWKAFDIEAYLYRYLNVFLLASCLVIPFEDAYLAGSSGPLFRGIWNHPNDFGVICAIYLAAALVRCKEIGWKQIGQILVVFVLIFLSKSRGAMISAVGTIAVYGWLCKNKSDRKVIALLSAAALVLLLVTSLGDTMADFFVKGSGVSSLSADMFVSREGIYESAMQRFGSSPIFGRGLMIPYTPGRVSFAVSAEGIEPGNIFLELLAGTGIVGLVAFIALVWKFFSLAEGKRKIYSLAAVLASISEVSFFSVNNYAFIYYAIIALSIVGSGVLSTPKVNADLCHAYE